MISTKEEQKRKQIEEQDTTYGVAIVDGFSPGFQIDERPKWAQRFRATMDHDDLLALVEDMAIEWQEQTEDAINRLNWLEEETNERREVGAEVEMVSARVQEHGVTLRQMEGSVARLDTKVDDIDAIIDQAVSMATAPFMQQVEDLKVELKEAFDLIESLEDAIDHVA